MPLSVRWQPCCKRGMDQRLMEKRGRGKGELMVVLEGGLGWFISMQQVGAHTTPLTFRSSTLGCGGDEGGRGGCERCVFFVSFFGRGGGMKGRCQVCAPAAPTAQLPLVRVGLDSLLHLLSPPSPHFLLLSSTHHPSPPTPSSPPPLLPPVSL